MRRTHPAVYDHGKAPEIGSRWTSEDGHAGRIVAIYLICDFGPDHPMQLEITIEDDQPTVQE